MDAVQEGTFSLNIQMMNERLTNLIRRCGAAAMESRQIARRLHELLPMRFAELKREHARQHRPAEAERLALTDERYLRHLEELNEVSSAAARARIEYETYAMLYKARQTLRAFNAASRTPRYR